MSSKSAPKYADPVIQPLFDFAELYNENRPAHRVKLAKKLGTQFREKMLQRKPVAYYQSFDLVRAPYPLKYGLRDACTSWTPLIHILNRLFVVQFQTKQGLKTLLVSPTDVDSAKQTPYFKRLGDQGPPVVQKWVEPIVAPRYGTVEQYLDQIGLNPSEIDYITYDHLHTQSLKKWLGDGKSKGYFPNAKLLVTKQEWESTQNLTGPQLDWYCPGGIEKVPEDRVILFDDDIALGDSVFLIRTSGHTEGNHSIVVRTDDGLFVTSENGISADAYEPLHSNIPGVRQYAISSQMEVVLNGNTLEKGLDQYVSMILEKSIAGPSKENSNFANVVPSSELSYYWLFPVTPTFTWGQLKYGKLSHASEK